MLRPSVVIAAAVLLSAASPAAALDAGQTRLTLGLDPALSTASLPSLRFDADGAAKLDLGLTGPIAAGPAAAPAPDGFRLIPGGHGRMALGGFLEMNAGALRIGGSIAAAQDGGRAEVSAVYGLGDTSLILRLGGTWADSAAITPDSLAPAYQDGIDLSVTLRHALTPSLYVAGTAAATSEGDMTPASDRGSVLFGASIGLRF